MINTPTFPTHYLPSRWGGWIDTTAARLGVPTDYLAAGLFASLAAATGKRVVAEPVPGWTETLDLWLCQVGAPWAGKSRALDAASELLPDGAGRPGREDELAPWLARKRNRAEPRIVGALRPPDLADVFAGKREILTARFLFFWPKRPAWRDLSPHATGGAGEGAPSLAPIAALAPDPAAPLVLPFTPQALALFNEFCAHTYREIGEGDGPLAAWLANARSTVARLALGFTLLDWCAGDAAQPPAAIDKDALDRALVLYDEYFRPQAARVLQRTAARQRLAPVERVLRWLQETGVETVSREEVRRHGLSESMDAAGAAAVIDELVERGVLELLPPPVGKPGRPSHRWRVCSRGFSETRKTDGEPGRRRGPVVFEMPAITKAEDLQPALIAIGRQTAEGKLTPNECQQLSGFVKLHMAIIEVVDFEKRLKVLEADTQRGPVAVTPPPGW